MRSGSSCTQAPGRPRRSPRGSTVPGADHARSSDNAGDGRVEGVCGLRAGDIDGLVDVAPVVGPVRSPPDSLRPRFGRPERDQGGPWSPVRAGGAAPGWGDTPGVHRPRGRPDGADHSRRRSVRHDGPVRWPLLPQRKPERARRSSSGWHVAISASLIILAASAQRREWTRCVGPCPARPARPTRSPRLTFRSEPLATAAVSCLIALRNQTERP